MIPDIINDASKRNDSSNSETDYELEENFGDPDNFVDDVSDEGKNSYNQ